MIKQIEGAIGSRSQILWIQTYPKMDAQNPNTEVGEQEERSRQRSSEHYKRTLDMTGEEEFDHLLGIAREVSGAPISLLSFIDNGELRIKASKGIEGSDSSTPPSIYQHFIQGRKPVHIEDLSQEPVLKDSNLVKGRPYLRAYLGAPIIDPEGNTLGSLCLADRTPGPFHEKDERILQQLATQAMSLLEKRLGENRRQAGEEKLSERILEAEEKLRVRIGQEIHDGLAQDLTGASLFLEQLKNELEGIDNEQIPEYMHNIQDSLKDAIQKSRSLSHEMKLKKLDRSGLVEGIQSLLLPFDGKGGDLAAHFQGELDESRMTLLMKKNLYRIVQEILNHTIRHSGGDHLFLRLKESEGNLHLDSWDNGKGMRAVDEDEDPGLRCIRGRAEALGGKVSIENYPRKGLSCDITIPLG